MNPAEAAPKGNYRLRLIAVISTSRIDSFARLDVGTKTNFLSSSPISGADAAVSSKIHRKDFVLQSPARLDFDSTRRHFPLIRPSYLHIEPKLLFYLTLILKIKPPSLFYTLPLLLSSSSSSSSLFHSTSLSHRIFSVGLETFEQHPLSNRLKF